MKTQTAVTTLALTIVLLSAVSPPTTAEPLEFEVFQVLPTGGTVNSEFFTIGTDHYLAADSSAGSVNSRVKIYKWSDIGFIEHQILANSSGVSDCHFFTIGADYFLVLAIVHNGTSYNSDVPIYKWDEADDEFVEHQTLPTNASYDWASFTIDGDFFLAVANYYNGSSYNLDSKIYIWRDGLFEEYQSLQTHGAFDFEFFTIGATPFLAVANRFNQPSWTTDSIIYAWNGNIFAEHSSVTTSGASDLESFRIDTDFYLAVANYSDGPRFEIDSKIYKWTGADFAEYQSIPTSGAFDWEFFTAGTDSFLALANYRDNANNRNIDSKIYRWDSFEFFEVQAVPTSGARDWESFAIGNDSFLVVSNRASDAQVYGAGISNGDRPTLVIPAEIPAGFGSTVDVPIIFTSNGLEVAATTFSVDYDETCLGFDPADTDLDGELDNVSFSLPPGFGPSVSFAAGDFDGELDIAIFDPGLPLEALPDGDLATITFTTLCEPAGTSIIAPVSFSDLPAPTFGDTLGQDVPGDSAGGSVEILPGARGDCNGDGSVTAGDLSACVLEVFDEDGTSWLDAPGGAFPGSPVGCDANADELINAGDLSCKILLIFDGPGACDGARSSQSGWGQPALYMGKARQKAADAGAVSVPVYFHPRVWEINSLIFSVDYDENTLAFDASDKDGDGAPDAIRLDLPASAQVTVSFDRADTDGEIDIAILDPSQALDRDERKPLLALTLERMERTDRGAARVSFSNDPAASFGDLSGRSVEGTTSDGSNR
ncbi:MAG: hypothetical protein GY719_31355 [bacterium]|nr:hypothetical protein [bacterium]